MSRLGKDYYTHNLLTRLAALDARLAALERRPPDGDTLFTGTGGDAPTGSQIRPLLVVEEETGDVYQIVCVRRDERPLLKLRLVSRGQEGGTA